MIVANKKDAKRYYQLNENFKTVFDFLESLTPENLPEGIVGDGYRVNLSGKYVDTFSLTASGEPRPFEAHKKYIDIHYCIDGSEAIGYNDVSRLTPTTEYDEKDDYFLLSGESFNVILHPGDFCIVFPEDAHIPCLPAGNDTRVLKAVAKIIV